MQIVSRLTSAERFVLIGYWRHDAEARRGARLALLVTGGGGLALLGAVMTTRLADGLAVECRGVRYVSRVSRHHVDQFGDRIGDGDLDRVDVEQIDDRFGLRGERADRRARPRAGCRSARCACASSAS